MLDPDRTNSAVLNYLAFTLRLQAWERAKGELHSILHTYYPEWTSKNQKVPNGFEGMDARIQAFIAEMEENIK